MKDVSLDILLAMDYVISMQYFRVFRWDGCLLGVDESKQILQSQPAALQQFHEGFVSGVWRVGLVSSLACNAEDPNQSSL